MWQCASVVGGELLLTWRVTWHHRCLGDLPFKADGRDVVDCTPEMRRIELQPGDSAVVLATDGVWDVLSDTDAVGIITKVAPTAPTPPPSP